MQTLVERGCGLDVHQATVVACLLIVRKNGNVQKQLRTFGTTIRELLSLHEWLLSEGCTPVALESTGVYWKPVYAILEGAFQIVVANEQSGSRICSATAYSAPDRVQSGKNLRILNRHLQICVLESVRRFYISPREDGDGKRDHDDEGSAGQNYCIGMKRKSVLMVIQGLE
jgi:hypothetical protein